MAAIDAHATARRKTRSLIKMVPLPFLAPSFRGRCTYFRQRPRMGEAKTRAVLQLAQKDYPVIVMSATLRRGTLLRMVLNRVPA